MQKKVTEEIIKRIEKLKNEEKIFIAYHFDVDGCASASILWRILQGFGLLTEFCPVTRGFEQVAMEKIRKSEPSKVLLVDYVPGEDFVRFLEKYNTEVMDHHTHEDFLEKFEYFTSADYELNDSISYLLSMAAENLGVKKVKWLGHIGAFWDKCLESTEFYREGAYREDMEKMLPFNLLVNLTQIKGSERLFQVLNESSDMEEALEKIKEIDDYKRAKKIFEDESKDIKFSRKYYSDIKLSIYWVKTRFKHIRMHVDFITYTTPGTHVFVLDENTRFKLSFRTSLNINIQKIVKEITKENKNFSGGGHPQACGGMLKSENIEELLSTFIEKYRKIISE